jgi:hypothetical protein
VRSIIGSKLSRSEYSPSAREYREIRYCSRCSNHAVALAEIGCFPASPTEPRLAFSFEAIKFYLKMNNTHKVPVQTFVNALASSLEDRGYHSDVLNPYYQQFQNCCHWFDSLLRKIETMVGIHVELVAEPVGHLFNRSTHYSLRFYRRNSSIYLIHLICKSAEYSCLVGPVTISESDVLVALGGRDGEEMQKSESPTSFFVEIRLR